MNKIYKLIYIIVFFILCALPAALMPFFKNSAKLEKRSLTAWPSYVENGHLNVSFSDDFESAFNDRIPLRASLLTAANFIKGEVLHAATSNVIVGKDGWLFFNSEAPDYLGTKAMSEHEVRSFAITLSLVQEHIATKGGHFLFVPVPNKSSVYGEYMPSAYRAAQEHDIDRISRALEEEGVSFVDMKQVLTDAKAEGLYHVRDSHWNYKGAYVGYSAIMEALGKPCADIASLSWEARKDWRGDLDKLLYPAAGTLDTQYYNDLPLPDFEFTSQLRAGSAKAQLELFMSDKEEHDDNFSTLNHDLSDGSSLFMARDSFARAILPDMIASYETATFQRTSNPDLNSWNEGTDYILEIAERNLSRIIDSAPNMYAPLRESTFKTDLTEGGSLDVAVSKSSFGPKLYGMFPEGADMGDGRVYIRLEQDGTTYLFEAFPIYESNLLGEGSGDGFTLTLSPDYALSGTCHVTVIRGETAWSGPDLVLQ